MDREDLGNGALASEMNLEIIFGCESTGSMPVEVVRLHVCAERGFRVCGEGETAALDILNSVVRWCSEGTRGAEKSDENA